MTDSGTGVTQVDVRGPRFAAWVTTGVLALVILLSAVSPGGIPTGWFSRPSSPPRLGPVTEREPVAPLRFAQLVGLVFAVIGLVGYASGLTAVGVVATAFALFAAFLNASFGICLGCKMYPLLVRIRHRGEPA